MGREKLSLDMGWKFHLGETGLKIGKGHGEIYALSKAGSQPGAPQADFDASEWEDVQLPHDWSASQAFSEENVADWGYKPRGKAWYRKTFRLPEEYRDKKLVICFEGVATHCTVYFNGLAVARSFSGYTPFEADITDMAHFGEIPNVLAVFVEADEWEGWWYEGAGIYRHVWLEAMNLLHIDRDSVFICPLEDGVSFPVKGRENSLTGDAGKKPEEKSVWNVDVSMEFINERDEEKEIAVQLALREPGADRSVRYIEESVVCQTGTVEFSARFAVENPLIWDINHPNVYSVEVTALCEGEKIDSVRTVCGFRTVEMDPDKGFFLNHQPLKLFGTCNHQDFGGLGVAVPDNLWEYRIEKLKEMGSNAYRCAHGMPADALIDACDRMGMLVLDENRNFDSTKEGLRQIEMLVKRHRNHPSVIMYSIFNEEPLQGTLQGRRMAKRMCRLIHRLAPGSLTTGAMHGGILTEENAVSEVDVCGINYQIDEYDSFHKRYPDIPMLGTETTSTFGVRGCYATDKDTHQIASYDDDPSDWGNNVRDTWRAVMERDFVAGAFMWTGFDYLGEPTPYVWPTVSSYFGMLDICGFPKDGFYLAKAVFSEEPVCHVLPHWNFRGQEGRAIRVMSHTNCEEAELFVNGRSMGRKKIDIYAQAEWEVPYEAGTIELAGYNNGEEAARDVRETTGCVQGLQVIPWRSTVKGNGQDAVPVVIKAVDAEGREVPDANFMTEISVEGGRLLGACNGNPNCHEEFLSPHRSIFNGRCLAVVMPDEDASNLKVCVKADIMGEAGDGGSGFHSISADAVVVANPAERVPSVPSVTEYYLARWKISKVFKERPDVMMKIEDFDMNSWQDISVSRESGSPDSLENKQGHYLIYQLQAQIPKRVNGHLPVLYFHAIWGECEIYINGERRGTCSYEWPCSYSIPLNERETGAAEIRILVRSLNINAGLDSMVVLR